VPELPEVQTVVDDLNRLGLAGSIVSSVQVYWPRAIDRLSPADFTRTVTGCRIESIRRRGKFIVFKLSERRHLLVHLRMSGRLTMETAWTVRTPHQHVILELGPLRQLRFHDPRKFGRFYLVDDPAAILERLGPEPLDRKFSARELAKGLRSRKRLLKPLLLDQHFVAGLGNIYADEALYDAGLHPLRRSDSLSEDEIRRLHRSIRKVLRKGLRNLGTSLGKGASNFHSLSSRRGRNAESLQVFRRTGETCRRCAQTIQRIIVGQRATHLCPFCQKLERQTDHPGR
jgi:formamidopyrimidine-DNA glycosylase